MKFLNLYFFGEEKISLHDFVWFYSFYVIVAIMLAVLAIIVL